MFIDSICFNDENTIVGMYGQQRKSVYTVAFKCKIIINDMTISTD